MAKGEYQATLTNAIQRQQPEVEAVEFDKDGEHVYLVTGDVALRYRLGQDCQRFLAGEFPLDEFDAGLMLMLEAPRHAGGPSESDAGEEA